MTKYPGDILLLRYLEGNCSEDEQEQIERWLCEDDTHADRLMQFAARQAGPVSIGRDRIKNRVLDSITEKTSSEGHSSSTDVKKVSHRYRSRFVGKWVAAVVILLIVSAGATVFLSQLTTPAQGTTYIEHTVPRGETALITLSDGSNVHLNAGSTLRFPEHFGSAFREVYLKGEAFFDVAADKQRPFNVYAGGLKTTVLGTAFNVKAFPGEGEARVAVEHGKVSVEMIAGEASSPPVLLEPEQWVIYNSKSKELKKEEGDISQLIAWKDGTLLFHNKTVAEVVTMLERWYGIDITVESEAVQNCVLYGEHKDESLENVLKAMQFALDLSYSFTEKGVVITGGGCR